ERVSRGTGCDEVDGLLGSGPAGSALAAAFLEEAHEVERHCIHIVLVGESDNRVRPPRSSRIVLPATLCERKLLRPPYAVGLQVNHHVVETRDLLFRHACQLGTARRRFMVPFLALLCAPPRFGCSHSAGAGFNRKCLHPCTVAAIHDPPLPFLPARRKLLCGHVELDHAAHTLLITADKGVACRSTRDGDAKRLKLRSDITQA